MESVCSKRGVASKTEKQKKEGLWEKKQQVQVRVA
jgi:hypothetical protein